MLHYALTNALVWASDDFKQLNKWADQYNANVNTKYGQVCVPTRLCSHLIARAYSDLSLGADTLTM